MLKAKGIYYINAQLYAFGQIRRRMRNDYGKIPPYRMPGKLIMNAEDEIITELMED